MARGLICAHAGTQGGRGNGGEGAHLLGNRTPPAGTQEAWGPAFTQGHKTSEEKSKESVQRLQVCTRAWKDEAAVLWTKGSVETLQTGGAGMLRVSGSLSCSGWSDAFCPHAPQLLG